MNITIINIISLVCYFSAVIPMLYITQRNKNKIQNINDANSDIKLQNKKIYICRMLIF